MAKAPVLHKDELPLMMTMRDVQQVTRLARDVAYRLPHTEGFPVIRFGRVFRVPRDRFFAWLETQADGNNDSGQKH
jgi:hypothetical protein